ncbi:MAG: response regulator [Acidobacteriota bacterium]
MRTRVFMVDDEADLVWTTTRHFRRERPDLEFRGFSDPIEALQAINKNPPHLLITDLRMEKLDGLELIQVARERSPDLLVLIATAYSSPEVSARASELGALRVFEKPYNHRELISTVDRALVKLSSFSGQLSLPVLSDLVQMLALSQRVAALRITQGEASGVMWFDRGELVHCEYGEIEGRPAFLELLRLKRGKFQMEYEEPAPKRTIEEPVNHLLLDSFREIDESNRDAEAATNELETGTNGQAASAFSNVLASADRWLHLSADKRTLGEQPFVGLVSLHDSTALILEADNDEALEHVGPWVTAMITAASRLDAAPEGSLRWFDETRAWSIAWRSDRDAAVVYGERRGAAWRSGAFEQRAAKVFTTLLEVAT